MKAPAIESSPARATVIDRPAAGRMSERFGKADHNSLGIQDFEIPFSPVGILGFGGRQAFFNKIPVERVNPMHAKNYANPTMVCAGRALRED